MTTAVQLVSNPQFGTAGDLSNWNFASGTGPTTGTPATVWPTTVKPANGSGGVITFPAGTFTATPYAPPAANAPPGNAAYMGGFRLNRVGGLIYNLPALYRGRTYTLSWWYAGNAAQSSLHWYRAAHLTLNGGAVYGDFLSDLASTAYAAVDPTAGWVQETVTFTPDADSPSGNSLTLFGCGSDVAAPANGSIALTGATVVAPLLVGNVTLSTASVGAVNFPQPQPFGSSANTYMQGSDSRIPIPSYKGLRHPRTERIPFQVQTGTLVNGTIPLAIPVLGGGSVRQVTASVGSLTPGGSLTVDVLLGGVSLFTDGAMLINSVSPTGVGAIKYVNVPVSSTLIAAILSSTVTIGVGTAVNLAVDLWVDYP